MVHSLPEQPLVSPLHFGFVAGKEGLGAKPEDGYSLVTPL